MHSTVRYTEFRNGQFFSRDFGPMAEKKANKLAKEMTKEVGEAVVVVYNKMDVVDSYVYVGSKIKTK